MTPERKPRHERSLAQRQERRRRLLEAAATVAVERGFLTMRRRDVAAKAGVATGSVNHEFETMDGLRDALLRHAIENENLPIIAQGLACGHPIAREAPADLRARAVAEAA